MYHVSMPTEIDSIDTQGTTSVHVIEWTWWKTGAQHQCVCLLVCNRLKLLVQNIAEVPLAVLTGAFRPVTDKLPMKKSFKSMALLTVPNALCPLWLHAP